MPNSKLERLNIDQPQLLLKCFSGTRFTPTSPPLPFTLTYLFHEIQLDRTTPGLTHGKDGESMFPEDRPLAEAELSCTCSIPSFKLTSQIVLLLPCSELGCKSHQLLFFPILWKGQKLFFYQSSEVTCILLEDQQ